MNEYLTRTFARLQEQMQGIDEVALVILKGHLLIEEALDRITTKFVHHGEHLVAANFRFAQRVALARSLSTTDHDNSLWEVIKAINVFRNHLAHSLEPEKRATKFAVLKDLYLLEVKDPVEREQERALPDQVVAMYAIALCLGFLDGFEAEVDRFRSIVDHLDR